MSGRSSRKLWGVLGAFGLVLATGVIAIPSHDDANVQAAPPTFTATDNSKVPHYFGPYSNWANSPQVLTDAVVSITDATGTGALATATVNPVTGAVTAVAVTSNSRRPR